MALTKAREIALFQILEIPYSLRVNYLIQPGQITAEPRDATNSAYAARTLVLQHLTDNIYPDTDIQTVLEARLDDWINLGIDTTSMEQGSVGNVAGLRMDPDADRAEIRRQVLILVPFYRAQDEISRGNSSSCPIIH
jgi:hypothetical protein